MCKHSAALALPWLESEAVAHFTWPPKHTSTVLRACAMWAAGVFFNLYTAFYMLSPRHCHAFVGYLEEEAVKTYTHCLHDIDSGKLPEWATKRAPEIAISYWQLDKNATMRDVILAVRCSVVAWKCTTVAGCHRGASAKSKDICI